jgi:hypothetical protein
MCTGSIKPHWPNPWPDVLHRFYSFFGYSVEIRIQSPTFQADLKKLGRLAESGPLSTFKTEHGKACKRYDQNDPELIRLNTFAEFMSDDHTMHDVCELCGNTGKLKFNDAKCAWGCENGCPD